MRRGVRKGIATEETRSFTLLMATSVLPCGEASSRRKDELVPKTAFPGRDFAGDWVLTEKSPVDSEFDHLWTIDGPFSGGVGPYISLRKCRWNLRSKLVTIKIISQPTVFAFVSSS